MWNSPGQVRHRASPKRWSWAAVVILAVLLWLPRLSGPIDLRWDGSVYYLLGVSLADGRGYRIHSEPGAPEALQYPPLLPAFVALHAKLLGTTKPEIVARNLRISYAAIFLLYALAVLTLARRFLPPIFAFIATLICLLYSETIFFSDLLYAEIPFALITVLFVLVASGPPQSWLREAAGYFFAAAAFLLRTAGLVLLIAWVLDAIICRRWRLAVMRTALALIPIVAWQMHVARVRSSYDYQHPAYEYQRAPYQYSNVSYSENARLIDPFHPERGRLHPYTLLRRVVTNAPRMIAAVGETVSTKKRAWDRVFFDLQARHRIIPLRPLVMIAVLPLAALAFTGILILASRRAFLIVFILIGSMALALTTPWRLQFTRYMVPVGAFLSISTMLAIVKIRDLVQSANLTPRKKVVVNYGLIAVPAIVLAAQLFAVAKVFRDRASKEGRLLVSASWPSSRLFVHDATWQNFERAAQWIKENSSRDAIVATSLPHFLHLLTGRLAVIPPLERDPTRARQLLESALVSYVIIDHVEGLDMARTYARPAVESDPEHWRLVFGSGQTRIYARAEDAHSGPEG
jgi:selenocysteine-specific elongation factor-like protein